MAAEHDGQHRPALMTAIGWCEDCGDVEVEPMCLAVVADRVIMPPIYVRPSSCHDLDVCHIYADCPHCGEDVDQWAWT